MSKSTAFIITFLWDGCDINTFYSNRQRYNRSCLMDAWFIGGLMIVIDIFYL